MNVKDFQKMKKSCKKISMVTCYDTWSAKIIESSSIDSVLVGDSAAMVMHGAQTTIPATLEMMKIHTKSVAQGIRTKFIVSDLPFLSFRKSLFHTMNCVESLMQAGAHAVKIEGVSGLEKTILNIVSSGVPVMGHIGLTPQSVHGLGGFKVQGKQKKIAEELKLQAKKLEDLGCFSLVLECVPSGLAQEITESLVIPSIGVGAGRYVDGQILVLHDVLGLSSEGPYKFVKKYLDGSELIKKALNGYVGDVQKQEFPLDLHSFH